jgi:uncharacterized protein YggU (UPF0235/DUF167 family)
MRCNVKPGTNKNREGIAAVNEEAVEICVAAQAREGEANKAVVRVLSEVCIVSHKSHASSNSAVQVLDLPKSDLQITQGLKSRSKTVAAAGSWINSGEDECLRRAKEYLDRAIDSS